MAGRTLVEALSNAGENRGVFFVEDTPGPALPHQPTGPRTSWATLAQRARTIAGALQKRGIRPGDPIAIVLPTGPEFLDSFFGAQFAGAIPVPLYPPVRLGRLPEYHARTLAMLQACEARMVLTDARIWRVLGPVIQAHPLPCLTLDELGSGPPTQHPSQPQDLALIQFSSGTTVAPKPVALSHAAILANVRAIVQTLYPTAPPPEAQVGASWLPLYHDMGLVGCLLLAADHPGDLHLMRPEAFLIQPALWLRTLSRSRATISPAPNFAYALCTERVTDTELEGANLSAWQFALNGAEPVAPQTLRKFTERFSGFGLRATALTPVYGLSEASLAVTFSSPHQAMRTAFFDRDALADGLVIPCPPGSNAQELVSLGPPLTGMAVDAPTDHIGPVKVQGPSLMSGYYRRPEATAAALQDGWLDTGDLGFLFQGELYLAGRAKDIIILRGKNHAPHDLEQTLDTIDGVRTGCAAAVGYRGEHDEHERLLIFVEVKDTPSPELIVACRSLIFQHHQLNAEILLLAPGTLPRTSSGKIRRAETLKQWQQGELHPPDPVTPWLLARAAISGTIAHWRTRKA